MFDGMRGRTGLNRMYCLLAFAVKLTGARRFWKSVFCCHSAPRGKDAPMILVCAGSFHYCIVFPIVFRFSANDR